MLHVYANLLYNKLCNNSFNKKLKKAKIIPKHNIPYYLGSINLTYCMILKPHKLKHQVTLFASLRDYFAYGCKTVKKESRCCVNDAVLRAKSASVWVITRNRFGISMSLDEVSTDRLFPLLTNVHYDRPRRLLLLLVLVRT